MKKFIIVILIIILLIYNLLFWNTNNIISDFNNVVQNNKEDYIYYGELERYSIPEFVDYEYVDTKISRLLVLHNFKKGVVWVKYSYIAYNNKIEVAGSTNIISKWYIEKKDNRWIVTKIFEAP